jgi:lysozyme
MTTSLALLHFLAQPDIEGMRLTAYPDGTGIWTIGVGHTSGVSEGMTCTLDQVYTWLGVDMASAAAAVNHSITEPMTQNEFDAFTSLAFNIGVGNFMYQFGGVAQFNSGRKSACAEHFLLWNKAGGIVEAGLNKRRSCEAILFLGGPWQISRFAVNSVDAISTETLTRCMEAYA